MEKPLGRIEAKKSLGQHFLNNERVPRSMADAALVAEGDLVVEVGPGTGVLTRELLVRGARVVALEADERAIAALRETFQKEIESHTLTIFHTDVRKTSLRDFGLTEHAYKVVANIPYYLSGMLFRTFLQSDTQPSALVFLVQKEVAHRIARDTKESLLSLSVKAYGSPRHVKTVGKGNFTPQPQVDSAIIAVSGISHERFLSTGVDEPFFFDILHLGLSAKRKQLLGNLAKRFDRDALTHTFSTLSLPLSTRGEDLSIDAWLNLAKKLSIHRI